MPTSTPPCIMKNLVQGFITVIVMFFKFTSRTSSLIKNPLLGGGGILLVHLQKTPMLEERILVTEKCSPHKPDKFPRALAWACSNSRRSCPTLCSEACSKAWIADRGCSRSINGCQPGLLLLNINARCNFENNLLECPAPLLYFPHPPPDIGLLDSRDDRVKLYPSLHPSGVMCNGVQFTDYTLFGLRSHAFYLM